jgi:hypothetical protein
MSYPQGLDEYPTDLLVEELRRRALAIHEGNCIYCGRPPEADPCKMDEMHAASSPPNARKALYDKCNQEAWNTLSSNAVLCRFLEQHALQGAFVSWLETQE